MSEKTLWSWLKKRTKHWHITRVENVVALGTPDVNYCAETGMEGWIELKFAAKVNKMGYPAMQHPLTPQQEHFLNERHRCGSCSGILLQVGREHFLVPAAYASEFNNMSLAAIRKADILSDWLKEGYVRTATAS